MLLEPLLLSAALAARRAHRQPVLRTSAGRGDSGGRARPVRDPRNCRASAVWRWTGWRGVLSRIFSNAINPDTARPTSRQGPESHGRAPRLAGRRARAL